MRKGNQTQFALEREMRAPAEKWLRDQGLFVKHEFALPWGICDLVGCSINKVNAAKRIRHGQKRPIGSPFRVLLLENIPDFKEEANISLDELCRRLEGLTDKESIHRELLHLARDKFIVGNTRGLYQKLNGWMPLHKRLVAVELKLNKVNEALHQAICNLEFADESYVAFPMETAKKVFYGKKKIDFDLNCIGIIGLDRTNCRVFKKAKPSLDHTNELVQKYAVELFWRSYSTSIAT